MKHALLLAVVLAASAWAQEAPPVPVPEVSPPPLLNDATPLTEVPAPTVVDPAFIEALDRQLLSFRQEGMGLRLANKEKSLGLGSFFWDDKLESMFAAVPASVTLFKEARDKTFISSVLTLTGFIGLAGSVAVIVVFLLAPVPSLAVLVIALVLDVAALVLSLVSIPFRMRAQQALFEAVEVHNRGLLRLPVVLPRSGLQPLPGGLAFSF